MPYKFLTEKGSDGNKSGKDKISPCTRKSGTREDVRPVIRKSRVTGKYKHLVTLDCGHSVTYAQIALYYRQNGNDRYIK